MGESGDSELACCCEEVEGVVGGNLNDEFEVISGTFGLLYGKRRHGVIFNGRQLASCELPVCFEGEKDSVRLARTDKFSEVDSMN